MAGRTTFIAAFSIGVLLFSAASAAAATGPALAFVHPSQDAERTEIAISEGGDSTRALAGTTSDFTPVPSIFASTSWTPDGRSLVFAGVTKAPGDFQGPRYSSLYLVAAGGGAPRRVPNTSGGSNPVVLPDGRIAFARVRGVDSERSVGGRGSHPKIRKTKARTAIWLVAQDGTGARRLTRWRADTFEIPTSVSPDGRSLAISRSVRFEREGHTESSSGAIALDLESGAESPLVEDGGLVAYSPDGAAIAFVRGRDFARPHVREGDHGRSVQDGTTDVYVRSLATGVTRRVTNGPAVELAPTWDPSGQRLALVRFATLLSGDAALFGIGGAVVEVNADGTCLTTVLRAPGEGFLSPVFQPGHAAGRLTC